MIHEMQQQVKECPELLGKVLGADLLGVYLYGSTVVGGLQKYSDVDLFVVIDRATTLEEKKKLVMQLLRISGIYMKGEKWPIEMTLVEKAAINPWRYPPHFDFQYGEWLRTSFEEGILEPWQTQEMPDLAVIVTQVLLKSQTLLGPAPEQLLSPVPYADFMKAMLQDIDRLVGELEDDTRNVLLTCARIWSTVETDAIRSKPAAAEWVLERIPEKYQPVMSRAQAICLGKEKKHWEDLQELLKPCADYMVKNILAKQFPENSNKTIKLAEEPVSKEH